VKLLSAILLFFCSDLIAQEQTVTGIVISSEDLQPIAKVSVMVVGSNYGTYTDDNGKFTVRVHEGASLQFTHLTYRTLTRSLEKNKDGLYPELVVFMQVETMNMLDTVVARGIDPKRFEKDFMNQKLRDSAYLIASSNISAEKRKVLLKSTPTTGTESYGLVRQNALEGTWNDKRVAKVAFLDLFTWMRYLKWRKSRKKS
jgi:hypothetical protein